VFEELIAVHPAMLETGVAGIPHSMKRELPKAWVVLRNGVPAHVHHTSLVALERNTR
jgi:long-chain acyl-CoA synthetase